MVDFSIISELVGKFGKYTSPIDGTVWDCAKKTRQFALGEWKKSNMVGSRYSLKEIVLKEKGNAIRQHGQPC